MAGRVVFPSGWQGYLPTTKTTPLLSASSHDSDLFTLTDAFGALPGPHRLATPLAGEMSSAPPAQTAYCMTRGASPLNSTFLICKLGSGSLPWRVRSKQTSPLCQARTNAF